MIDRGIDHKGLGVPHIFLSSRHYGRPELLTALPEPRHWRLRHLQCLQMVPTYAEWNWLFLLHWP
jgi:hypothetical protein